jgi:hypothetical protein
MLVSHVKKFIFIKPIKTASTSVEMYFQRWCLDDPDQVVDELTEQLVGEAGIIGYRGWTAKGNWWYNHMPADLLRERIGHETWNSYYKFTMVRNPYERAISLFYWLIEHKRIVCPDTDIKQQFVWFLKSSREFVSDTIRYVIDDNYCHDAIIRYENLLEDIESVCRHLEIEWIPEKLGEYKSGVRPLTGTIEYLLNDESIEYINRSCAFEFKKFDYKLL